MTDVRGRGGTLPPSPLEVSAAPRVASSPRRSSPHRPLFFKPLPHRDPRPRAPVWNFPIARDVPKIRVGSISIWEAVSVAVFGEVAERGSVGRARGG